MHGCFLLRLITIAGAAGSIPAGSGRFILNVMWPRWELMSQRKEGFAKEFYASWPWIKCQRSYKRSVGGLCERCWSKGLIVPGEEVHHKIRLTPENINDPAIALNWDNLELLCKNCHLGEHRGVRWRADELGHVEL